jgi:NDP-sugar pyrophosphorylase family protein
MKGMILAAGEGTRLRPWTIDRPKVMLSIAGRPLLEHTVAWLKHFGVTDIAINLHYKPQVIQQHFADGGRFGVRIRYSLENDILGTAGGVKRLADFFDETFVMIYGDVLTDLDLDALCRFHLRQDFPHLTMSLYRVPNPTECGVVALDDTGRITRFVEKPPPGDVFSDLASAGVLIVDPEVLSFIPEEGFSDFGKDVFPALLNRGFPMYGWPIPADSYLIDIGSPEKYSQVQVEWPARAGVRTASGERSA